MRVRRQRPGTDRTIVSLAGMEPRAIVSPCSSIDSREVSVRRTQLSG